MSTITNKETYNEFKNVKFLLTSSMRTLILVVLYNKSKTLEEIRKELKKPSATILHGLKELEEISFIKKEKKYYSLTSNGYLLATNIIKLIDNWYAIEKNKLFWNSHDLSGIPNNFLNKVYLLKNANFISSTTSDLSNAFNTYINLLSNSRYITMILPIYSENHLKHIINLSKNDYLKRITLLTTTEIYRTIRKSRFLKKSLFGNDKISIIKTSEELKIFLTYSDDFMSLTLFFKDGHYDDSQILVDKNKDAIKWSRFLFDYYRQKEADDDI